MTNRWTGRLAPAAMVMLVSAGPTVSWAEVPAAQATPAPAPAAQTAAPAPMTPPPPLPTAVTVDNAKLVAKAMGDSLASWFGTAEGVQWSGEPIATVDGNRFRIELPALTVIESPKRRDELGRIVVLLRPIDPNQYQVETILPQPIRRFDGTGTQIGQVTLASQRFTGIWDQRLQSFPVADVVLGGMTVTHVVDGAEQVRARIGELSLRNDLKNTDGTRWSGTTQVSAKGIDVPAPKAASLVVLDQVGFGITLKDMDLADWPQVQSDLQKLPGSKRSEVGADWLKTLTSRIGDTTGTVTLNGLTINLPGGASVWRLATLALDLGLSGLKAEKSTFSLGYRHAGLSSQPPVGVPAFNPDEAELKVAAVDLPNNALFESFDKMIRLLPVNPQSARRIFLQEAGQNLSSAGSQIKVDSLQLKTPATATSMSGVARFNSRSPLGATADLNVQARGVDEAVQLLQPKPGEKVADETQVWLAALGILQAFGQQSKDDQGRTQRNYAIKVTQDGRISLNGADLSAIMRSIR